MKRFLTMCALVVLAAALGLWGISPAQAQAANLLQDPGFEGESYSFVSADPLALAVTYNVPAGWGGAVVQSPRSQPWMNVHPTGFPHTGPFRRSGNRSFHMARGGGTFTAYLYQRVNVVPGTPLQGGAWAFIDNGSGTSVVRAGIDPTGGIDPFSGSVVWSAWNGNGFNWTPVTVNSTAVSGTVTLFLFATQTFPVDPNGVYWDDAFLYGTAGQAPASPAGPSQRILTPNLRLSVRAGAGTQFNRLGVIARGESYAVLGESNGWYSISYNGQTGYVSGQYVTISQGQPTGGSAPAPAPQGPAAVTGQTFTALYSLRLRSGPATSFADLGIIPYPATLQVTGRSGDGNWIQVIYNGQVGWVAGWLGRLSGRAADLPVRG